MNRQYHTLTMQDGSCYWHDCDEIATTIVRFGDRSKLEYCREHAELTIIRSHSPGVGHRFLSGAHIESSAT